MNLQDPVFARTRYEYQSYSDFWRLVEISGFRTCYVDEIDLPKREIYITTPINGEIRPHVTHRRSILTGPQEAKIVWWNLERPDSWDLQGRTVEQSIMEANGDILKYADAVWVSDRWVASVDERSRFVVLGSHPEMSSGPSIGVEYATAHMSYITDRRKRVYEVVEKAVRIAPNAWGADRDRILRSTKAMLNVHQTPALIMEPLRVAVAAAYKLPYLSEEMNDPYPLEPGVSCLTAPYEEMGDAVVSWLNEDLSKIGIELHKRLCIETTFRIGVLKGLIDTFGEVEP
jgi:hypothetical protein